MKTMTLSKKKGEQYEYAIVSVSGGVDDRVNIKKKCKNMI